MHSGMIHSLRLTFSTVGIICAFAMRVQPQTTECGDKVQDPPGETEQQAMAAEARGDTRSALELMNQAAQDLSRRGTATDTARVESELGDIYLGHGDFNKAFKYKKKAFEKYREQGVLIEARRSALSLATVLLHRGDARGAGQYLNLARTLPVGKSCLDDDDRAAFASVSAWEDQLLGAPDLAVRESATALEFWRKAHGDDHPFVGWGHALLGDALLNAGEPMRALDEFRQATEVLAKSLPPTDKRYQAAVKDYTRELREIGRKDEAESVLRNSLLGH